MSITLKGSLLTHSKGRRKHQVTFNTVENDKCSSRASQASSKSSDSAADQQAEIDWKQQLLAKFRHV